MFIIDLIAYKYRILYILNFMIKQAMA